MNSVTASREQITFRGGKMQGEVDARNGNLNWSTIPGADDVVISRMRGNETVLTERYVRTSEVVDGKTVFAFAGEV
jgi:hypothetical protein